MSQYQEPNDDENEDNDYEDDDKWEYDIEDELSQQQYWDNYIESKEI